MKPHLLLSCLALTLTALVGCSNKPPSCSDEKTVNLVKQIFFESLSEKLTLGGAAADLLENMKRDTKVTLDSIRIANIDEKIGKVTCEAVLEIEPPAIWRTLTGPDKFSVLSANLKVKDMKAVSDIQYTSQRTDDKNEQLVELRGMTELVDLMVIMGRNGIFKAVSAAPTAPPAPAAPGMAAVTATSVEPPTAPAVYATPAVDAKSQVPSNEAEIAAARATPARTVSKVKLQLIECADYCHLKYADASGNMMSAICTEAAMCRSWAQNPKLFVPFIGATADLVLGKKFIPEGGETMDSVLQIIIRGS